ncbi:MAG: sigma-70 family RNA polymerase sigma factor [Patescibacteria group bacterium]
MSTKHPQTDSEVLRDSIKNPWMFGVLVDRYQEAFLRKASYILRSKELAEDAVQDTFLKIYKYADKFTEHKNASFNSWAYKILMNTCYSYASKKTIDREKVQVLDFGDLDILGDIDNSIGNEQVSFVHSVLTRLPEKFSRLLYLYFFEDKSYEEIAFIEEVSLSSVKSGLYRAKKQFKDVAINMT